MTEGETWRCGVCGRAMDEGMARLSSMKPSSRHPLCRVRDEQAARSHVSLRGIVPSECQLQVAQGTMLL